MSIRTLYITNKKHSWLSDIPLLDKHNFEKIIFSDENKDYWTSLPNIGTINLQKILPLAEKIELVNINNDYFCNFDNIDTDLSWGIGLLYYQLNRVREKVNNIDILDNINFKSLNIQRPNANPTLWIAGCSVTYGMGVKKEQTYGHLLAKQLDLQLVTLAQPGVSIFWAVDKLMRSDILPGDTVVLGITSLARYEYSLNWDLESKPCTDPKFLKFIDLGYFDSATHVLKCSRYILHLINFCNKIGAKIIVANLLDPTWTPIIFNGHPNFIDLIHGVDEKITYIDLGDDNNHPGPLQHQVYADKIFEHINEMQKKNS